MDKMFKNAKVLLNSCKRCADRDCLSCDDRVAAISNGKDVESSLRTGQRRARLAARALRDGPR